jgi:two-component system chemotaxis response regulator CheB
LYVVALAASAGGLRALGHVLSRLPRDFPAAILVLQHLDPHHTSALAEILGRMSPLPIKQAAAGDRLQAGVVHVAPPGVHMIVAADGTLALSNADLVHFVRPSADLLFESLAETFGRHAVAVVLTGTGQDGATGIARIKESGGHTIAQDKVSSEHFGMPGAAIRTGHVDQVLPLEAIAPALIRLVEKEGETGERG